MTKFQWDFAKYPVKQPLRNLAEIISKVLYVVVLSSNSLFDLVIGPNMKEQDCFQLPEMQASIL